jgi:rfaE bifunctional protein nucleotidyltransferase chain/domain
MSKDKIRPIEKLKRVVEKLQKDGLKVVFAYGAFDLLHAGHIQFLEAAKQEGDVLVVGVVADESLKESKGPDRPVVAQNDRAYLVSALECVDFVTIYEDENPVETVSCLSPDILVNGSDYPEESIAGQGLVKQRGGRAVNIPLLEGYSTSGLIRKIVDKSKDGE